MNMAHLIHSTKIISQGLWGKFTKIMTKNDNKLEGDGLFLSPFIYDYNIKQVPIKQSINGQVLHVDKVFSGFFSFCKKANINIVVTY